MRNMKYFSIDEFRCSHCNEVHMDDDFLLILDRMRDEAGFPFVITSGYRCPEYNNTVSSTGYNGPHTTGKAVDIQCSHKEADKVLELAYKYGITGKGIKQHGSGRFIHLDILDQATGRPRPHVWSY